MCTMIAMQVEIDGSGKGKDGWFPVRQLNVSYDHPYDMPLEHALNIDFVNEGEVRHHRHELAIANQFRNRRQAVTIPDVHFDFMTRGQLLDNRAQHVRTTRQDHGKVEHFSERNRPASCNRTLRRDEQH